MAEVLDGIFLPEMPEGEHWPLELVEAALDTAGLSQAERIEWANRPDVLPNLPGDFRAPEGERPPK